MSIFEVDGSVAVPRDKTELQELLRTNKAIPFHKRVCASCHGVPKSKEWMAANETDGKIYISFVSITFQLLFSFQTSEFSISEKELDILFIGR